MPGSAWRDRFGGALNVASLEVTRGRPLEGPGALSRLVPWVAAGTLAFLLIPFLPGGFGTNDLAAMALVPPVIALAVFAPWSRLPMWMQAVPAMVPFAMIGLVRLGSESPLAAYTPVVLIPVVWFALYGTRGQLAVSVLLVGVTIALPSPSVEDVDVAVRIAGAFLWMGISGISGLAISELVRQREQFSDRLSLLAHTDALTGLPNRRAWDEELLRELARAGRLGTRLCAAVLDLDHFKAFNDEHGHQAGDDHLRGVAVAWQGRLRGTDLVARYGGEEFALILSGTTLAQAVEVIETLRRSVPGDQTVSAGVAEWDGTESGAELLSRADRALYDAKRAGRDRTISLAAGPA
jgi:diguanylate cyclase (GGDEF)-like protein